MDIVKIVNELNFNDIVERETVSYLENATQFGVDAKKLLMDGQKKFVNDSDKIIYNITSINYLNNRIEWLNSVIRFDYIENYEQSSKQEFSKFDIYDHEQYQTYKDWDGKKKIFEAMIFFAVRELEKLGIKELEQNAFSKEEVNILNKKIDIILSKLKEVQIGQEIVFDAIEEFKSDFSSFKSEYPLGKRKWYQRASGAIFSYIGTKGADEIFEIIKPDIKELFTNYTSVAITKLLK